MTEVLLLASTGSASVTLDGSGSGDLDGDVLTYTWKEGVLNMSNRRIPLWWQKDSNDIKSDFALIYGA